VPGFWINGAVLACAIRFGWLGGGVAGLLLGAGHAAAAAVLLAGAAALTVTAYAVAARQAREDAVEGTTEAAALAVLALATLAGLGQLPLAAGCGAVLALALREKSAIQAFVRRLGEPELRAALQFAVLALVVLPILPPGPYGPLGGVRPRELWLVVLLVSGLNFAGYLARRAVGETRGTVLAGVLGGLVSSTAVTLALSRQSRGEPSRPGSLALGVVGACTILLPRVAIVSLALEPALTLALAPFLLPPLLAGAAAVTVGVTRATGRAAGLQLPHSRSPLRIGSAILLAIGFQAVLMATTFVQQHIGQPGVLATAALLGLTDMDALTISMSRLARSPGGLQLAATAVAVGVLASTVFKLGMVLGLGTGEFRRKAGFGLAGLALATVLGLWLGL
jgi:uncharacterized membrane protein (DUF4010 family)